MPPPPNTLPSSLRSLPSVRQTTSLLLKHTSHLKHFSVDLSAIDEVVNQVLGLIRRDYPAPSAIPFHSRWRHFDSASEKRVEKYLFLGGGSSVDSNVDSKVDANEKVRLTRATCPGLFVVSVLLDAGAGAKWKYKFERDGTVLGRSEGLALASLAWFLDGAFSLDPSNPLRVDAAKLSTLSLKTSTLHSKYPPKTPSKENWPLIPPYPSRHSPHSPETAHFFYNKQNNDYRPGNMLDYVLSHAKQSGVWPATRTTLDGISLGDVWPSQAIHSIFQKESVRIEGIPKDAHLQNLHVVAFHKLSQWLTYSLMEPFSLVGVKFEGLDVMTGLAEYRNGGLFVDMNVITLKKETLERGLANAKTAGVPRFEVFDDAVVEWRGLTVALLDLVGERVQKALGMILEAGTWKLGREVAAKLRPDTKGPPIEIISDGTVF
ncbi:DUF1688-domain-containing protein [Rhizoclosmatium globosum]|uniref:DUF1688-domain-containing protein n=1 Tax=Rhizoclosmatium globosum TaxID=329046 RepID=A0A1Y2B1G8_9FUNG|nr:DUF1688-domain-containing protein [Rhizoclosmatium globosum]|eukprot:ORY28400.1 DUF1688-domain-containing protein [Rhizoclosmatium globosum]